MKEMKLSSNPEVARFQIKEMALEREISDNPIDCPRCSMWRSGGDMSIAMRHCNACGARRAKSDISKLILTHANSLELDYEKVWDEAYELLMALHKNPPKGHTIYFDEDYFYSDLSAHFNKQIKSKPCTTSKETEDTSANPAHIIRNKSTEEMPLSHSVQPTKWNLKVAALRALRNTLKWFQISICLWYI